ncbi:hypothetical protein AVEN_163393-1, partial [Araneus ventricosus]
EYKHFGLREIFQQRHITTPMEDQDGDRDHVVIEMDDFDGRPLADRAAVPVFPRDGTRQHRIAPDQPVGVLDGRQVRRYVVQRVPQSRRRDFQTRRSYEEEPPDEESVAEQEITEEQRQWYRYRETRGIEDLRAPMSTEAKWIMVVWFVIVVLIIIALVLYWFIGIRSGSESDGDSGNMTVSMALKDFRSLIYEAL